MNKHLALLNVVGLSPNMLGKNTPHINKLLGSHRVQPLKEAFPAVTTTAQSTMLTGKHANEHGIVGNGWYFKDLAEVGFWKQNNGLVNADKIWHQLRRKDSTIKISNLFWWYNMYADVDFSMTPRPHYLADGGKVFDLYSWPKGLHQSIESKIGKFPFFNFWGPKAGIEASQWIAKAAQAEFVTNRPHLQLVYLPHLDYNLQRLGPKHPDINNDIQAIDRVCGDLIEFYQSHNVELMIVSEYGITEVNQPIHINRILRQAGFIETRETRNAQWPQGFESLDCGASDAFAVADHQCAHIYINNWQRKSELIKLLNTLDGVESVWLKESPEASAINHERAGDLILTAKKHAWFTYYYWLDDARAPDFARTVDIHRKPGYDPVEMFIDPSIRFPFLRLAGKLLKKKMGQRVLMDMIPLDANLIKGSHGRPVDNPDEGPLLIAPNATPALQGAATQLEMTEVYSVINAYFDSP